MNLLNIQLPKNNFHSLLQHGTKNNIYTNWHGSTTYENRLGIYTLTEEDNNFLDFSIYNNDKDAVIDYVKKCFY